MGTSRANDHPVVGQDARVLNDHLPQLLFGSEVGGLQQRGLFADLPDGVMDGHQLLSFQGLQLSYQRAACFVYQRIQIGQSKLSGLNYLS